MAGRLVFAVIVAAFFCIFSAITTPDPLLAQRGGAIDSLTKRAKTEIFTDPSGILTEAQMQAEAASAIADPVERIRILATAEWLQAQAKMRLGDIEGAKEVAAKGLARIGKNPAHSKLLGDLLLTLGNIAVVQSDVQVALPNFQRAHDAYQAAGNLRGQAMALQGLGNLYHLARDDKSALKYFEQSEAVYEADLGLSFISHNNHGTALLGLERDAEAEPQFKLALRSARKMGNSQYVVTVLANLAASQINQKKYSDANRTVDEALRQDLTPNDRTILFAQKAKIALDRGELKTATNFIDRAMSGINFADDNPALRDAYYYAYEIYSRIGRFDLATKHLETVWHMDEANVKVATSASVALMAAKFDFDAQKSQIDRLKSEQLEQDAAKQRLVLIWLGLVALILIASLVIILRSRDAERAAKVVLEDTNKRLEKAMAAKMEFLATTSHEIRTPLNGILGMTQVILADQRLDKNVRERIGILSSAGETMKALVNDILDVAKMENGNLSVEMGKVALRNLLLDAAKIWRVQAEQKGIKFDLDLEDCPDRIEGDGDRLRQVVFNLLSNAIKFTPEGTVRLKAAVTEIGDERSLRIAVSDSGIGIAPEWHERIFDTFQQVDGSKVRNFGGSGLGLAICRRLIEAMDGRIWVESVEDEGATFVIELPLLDMVIDEISEHAEEWPREERVILILEANPLVRGLYRAMLAEHYDVIAFVASFEEAVAYLDDNVVAHILVDEEFLLEQDAQLDSLTKMTKASVTLAANAENTKLAGAVSSRIGKPVAKDELLRAVGH